MLFPRPHNPTPYDDDWEDQPAQSPLHQWALGLLLPLALAAYALHAILTHQAQFGATIQITLHGLNATAFGTAILSAACFLHCHYFWGNLYNQAPLAVLGKILSAAAFIAALALLLIRNGVLGIN